MAELNFILMPTTKAYCTNQTLGHSLELCVSATCTVKDSLSMLLRTFLEISKIDSN